MKYENSKDKKVTNQEDLSPWQKEIIDERIAEYFSNPYEVSDFDKTIDDLQQELENETQT